MRRFSSSLRLLALGLLGLGAFGASPAVSASIVPHRAIYAMNLAGVKNGSDITDVSGRMLFEWRDVCDGWAIQQHMRLHFSYSDDDDQDLASTELTWESKDGKRYNFNIRRVTNGKETENYRGKAQRNDDGSVTVTYSVPNNKTVHLPVGTLFPTAHTELILENAARGDKFFTRRVFDGSDADGASDISAFVLPPRAAAAEEGLDAKMKENPLVSGNAFPVHMAFFKIGGETGEPDYEMDLSLMPSGIARRMKIDYGDFSVTGNLQEVEALPAQNCP
ncbi:MAG: cell envelope integrity EipB family protein [Alphaproteobacteria bacterium]|nr:cell envelope integrity EipB family protein [Alphaproteobacteria bacterium]